MLLCHLGPLYTRRSKYTASVCKMFHVIFSLAEDNSFFSSSVMKGRASFSERAIPKPSFMYWRWIMILVPFFVITYLFMAQRYRMQKFDATGDPFCHPNGLLVDITVMCDVVVIHDKLESFSPKPIFLFEYFWEFLCEDCDDVLCSQCEVTPIDVVSEHDGATGEQYSLELSNYLLAVFCDGWDVFNNLFGILLRSEESLLMQ